MTFRETTDGRSKWIPALVLLGASLLLPLPEQSSASGISRSELSPEAAEIRGWSDDGENDKAERAARTLLTEREKNFGSDAPEVAEALEMLVLTLARGEQGDLDGVPGRLALAQRALSIRRSTSLADEPGLARSWYMIGLVHYLGGDASAAMQPFAQALEIRDRRFDALNPGSEIYVRELGAALISSGKVAEALTQFERFHAIAAAKHGIDDPAMFGAEYNLAIAYQQLGRLDDADHALSRAETVLDESIAPHRRMLIRVRSERALVQVRRGELGAAVHGLETALESALSEHGPSALITASISNNLAFVLLDFGDASRAREVLQQRLTLEAGQSLPPMWNVRLRMNLGRALHRLGHLEEAQAEFDSTYRHGGTVLEQEDPLWAELHLHRGRLLAEMGRTAAAGEEFERALRLVAQLEKKPGIDQAEILAAAGRFDLDSGNASRARIRLSESLAIVDQISGESHRFHRTREDLAECFWVLESRQAAFDTAMQAALGAVAYDRATISTLAERQAMRRTVRRHTARDVAVTALLAGKEPPANWRSQAYRLVRQTRSIVFDELATRRRDWARSTSEAERANYRSWVQAKTRLANLFLTGSGGDPVGFADRLQRAQAALERSESNLAIRDRELTRATVLADQSLQARLAESEVLLSFLRFERLESEGRRRTPSYAAIVLRPGPDPPVWIDLGAAAPLEAAVEAWRIEATAPPQQGKNSAVDYSRVARELRRRIWDPLLPQLAGRSRVFVVPDGALHLVAFAALPGTDERYLLEEGPAFQYLTAERDLARPAAPAEGKPNQGLLLVSNPAFDASTPARRASPTIASVRRGEGLNRTAAPTCAEFRSRKFGPLPGTHMEALAVEKLWTRTTVEPTRSLSGASASEAAIKSSTSGQRILHFATHGYFLGGACRGDSANGRGIGELSGVPGARRPETDALAAEHPLLLSGLILAGANRRGEAGAQATGEDGVLTAEEVSALDLSGTELAVLSACDTGAGSVTHGEGLFGLRRAFMIAGVRSVVSNLWEVDDRTAQAWVVEMYRRRFVEHGSIADVVRNSSLSILNARREAGLDDHPFYWAGWTAAGS